MQGKIDPGSDHEQNCDRFDEHIVEIADTEIVRGKTADSDGAETMTDRIEDTHSGKPISYSAGYRHPQVDVP